MIVILIVLTALFAWIGYTYYLCKKRAEAVHSALSDFSVRLIGVGSSAEASVLYDEVKAYGDIHCRWIFFDVLPRYLKLLNRIVTDYQNFRRQDQEQLRAKK